LTLWRRRGAIAAAALALAAQVAFVTVPAYSAFDSIYSLVWGQDLLRGERPTFDAYRAPTQPLEGTDELHRLAAAAMTSTTVEAVSAVESITRWYSAGSRASQP
jgi:hypothetical protein